MIGNSMGGRVAIELGRLIPERVERLILLPPSLAWKRSRPWAPRTCDGYRRSSAWTRLRDLSPDCLFVWGRKDKVVPAAFTRHVEEALPAANHSS